MDSALDRVPLHHPFCSRNSERKVVSVVLLVTLLKIPQKKPKMAQRYVDITISDMSLLDMGECWRPWPA